MFKDRHMAKGWPGEDNIFYWASHSIVKILE